MRHRIAAAVGVAVLGTGSTQAASLCAGSFGYTGQIVSCTVGTSGLYAVRLSGAQGGSSAGNQPGGLSVYLDLTANLIAGASYDLLVGGRGANGVSDGLNTGGGGGGGSFIVLSGLSSALAVAGGGGGGIGSAARNASLGTSGQNGGSGLTSGAGAGAGGTNGLGGQSGDNGAGGGGGLLGSGTPSGGTAFVLGGAGQLSSGAPGNGGFGGGGAGGGFGSGGGGGGYSGGGGSNVRPGGGGGSYWDAATTLVSSQTGYVGATPDAAIYFELLEAAPTVPEPATWAMLIAGSGLAGGALRRRPAKVAFA